MSTATLLKSNKPADRKRGIQELVKLENEKALKILIKMYKTDPDPDVQALAKKAAAVIAKKLKAAQEAAQEPEPEPEPEYEFGAGDEDMQEVSLKDQARASNYIAAALSVGEDREKAMKLLVKAYNMNPALVKDGYFRSVASSSLGVPVDEALEILQSKDRQQDISNEQKESIVGKAVADHMKEAEKYTWGKVGIDIILLTIILFAGTLLTVMVFDFGARTAAAAATQTIYVDDNPDPDQLPPVPPLKPEKRAALLSKIRVMTDLEEAITLSLGAILATGVTLGAMPSLMMFLAITHPVAVRMMKGQGTLPYLVYNAMGAYTGPMIVMYLLLVFVGILIFLLGVPLGIGIFIVPGVVNLLLFIMSLRLLGAIGKSYHFGFGSALITAMIANIIPSAVMGAVGFSVSILIGAALQNIVNIAA